MRTMHQWLDEYGASHRNATNELLHWICVPTIVMTVLGMLWSIPVPQAFAVISPWLNWATIVSVGWIAYYFLLSPSLGIGAAICLVVFVVAWIGQFVGHSIEGTRPSFFKDVQFLLIGPVWLVSHVYRRLGVSY